MLSKTLENTLHQALDHANELHHEYATLEHLLFALTEAQDDIAVLRECGVDLERLRGDRLGVLRSIESFDPLVFGHSFLTDIQGS